MSVGDAALDWPSLVAGLRAWHTEGDRAAGTRALVAIEKWLRARHVPRLKRRASPEVVDDVLQQVLVKLWERPVLEGVDRPAGFVATMLRNAWVDHVRKTRRRAEEPMPEPGEGQEPAVSQPAAEAGVALEQVARALSELRVEDRVHIKICDAPHTLTWDELAWIGRRCDRTPQQTRDAVLDPTADVYALSFLVDPGPPPESAKARRDRLERFRRRRSRARTRLRAALEAP